MRQIIDQFFNGTENRSWKRIVSWMWYLILAGVVGVFGLFILLSFTDLPSVEQLENPRSEEATEIYAANGEVLGRYYTENRVPVNYSDLSPNLINALIATEDRRFYEHAGIDFKALGRVVVKTLLMGQESSGGASTITQQLAKLLFTGQVGSGFDRVMQKFKEWIIAVRLERRYTKEEIIQMYLNKFPFTYGAYGIKAASEIYFNTSQDSLSLNEAAMLVGMLKNPSLYNPISRQDLALQRRNVVLNQMTRNGYLDEAAYDTLRLKPLDVKYTRKTHIDGIATYFRMELAKQVREILDREENRKSDGSTYNIYTDGLKIYTTIDPTLQRIAEEEMINHMSNLQEVLKSEWGRTDPWTYEGDSENEVSVGLRTQTLNRLIRESERYANMRQRHLLDILDKIEEDYPDINFHDDDRDILRMIQESERKGHLDQLVSRGTISTAIASTYRKVMQSEHFPALVETYKSFQERVKKAFSEPVEGMKVFAYYANNLQADTTMTPIDSIKYHRFFLQTGILAVEPVTGFVKVWVGGINHRYFQFDHIRNNRQVGSTFKPFIYATAIERMGFSPCYEVYDLPQTIAPGDGFFGLPEEWTPSNFDGKYTGDLLTLKEGLRQSKNTVSVYLMKQIGDTEPVINLIKNMGIEASKVPKVPSISLGAADLSVMDMTGAYTTFANNGIYNKPTYLLRIEDKNGRTIFEELPQEQAALPPNANYVMVDMLRYAARTLKFSRTGYDAIESDVGGKTGTTNDFVDGWFMGVTPNLVVGTWVGAEDKWVHFRTSVNGQGAVMARPFFWRFMNRVEDEVRLAQKNGEAPPFEYDISTEFVRPSGNLGIELDCDVYANPDEELQDEDPFQEDIFSEDMFGDEAGSLQEDPFQQ